MLFNKKFESSGTSTDSFIILKDGESVEGVFAGNPYEFYQHWENKKPSVCTGRGCERCVAGVKASFRFRINFIVKAPDNTLTAKILEQGQMIYGQIQDLEESGYVLETNKFRISRKGAGMNDTQYTVLPVPKGELNAEALKAVRAVKLLDLTPQAPKQDAQQEAHRQDIMEAGVPF